MSVEAITDVIHEYMYENWNDSPETDKKKIRHVEKRKYKLTKEQADKITKFRKMDCNRSGAPNWSKQHNCPARGKKYAKSGQPRHYAKCCRSMKKSTT